MVLSTVDARQQTEVAVFTSSGVTVRHHWEAAVETTTDVHLLAHLGSDQILGSRPLWARDLQAERKSSRCMPLEFGHRSLVDHAGSIFALNPSSQPFQPSGCGHAGLLGQAVRIEANIPCSKSHRGTPRPSAADDILGRYQSA